MSKRTTTICEMELYRLLVENVTDYAIFMLDSQGVVANWNANAERIKGYCTDEIVGRHFSVFYTPEDRAAGLPQKELALARRSGRSEAEGWRVRKNGSRYWVNDVMVPIRNQSRKIVAFARISRNLTERREAEDALRMMNESLERRIRERTAALEISQNELKSLALQLSRAELRERQRIAAEVHSHLAQLLALAKIRVASLADSRIPGLDDLRQYVEHAIHYSRSLMTRLSPPILKKGKLAVAMRAIVGEMKAHGLRVTLTDDRKPKPVSQEALALLYQAVRELLFNVLKHARTQNARVTVRRALSRVEIHVQDSGVGFLPTPHQESSGFGLSHLRERLALLGGTLEILPNGSKGTHVLVTAPMSLPTSWEAASRRRLHRVASPPNGHIRVLIVDDNKLMREGLRKILSEQADLKVVGEAADGQTALTLARKTRPDVVVMDVNMPGMDGFETTWKLSQGARPPRVIGFSIHNDREVEFAIRKAGATGYVTKQESPEKLCWVIRKVAA